MCKSCGLGVITARKNKCISINLSAMGFLLNFKMGKTNRFYQNYPSSFHTLSLALFNTFNLLFFSFKQIKSSLTNITLYLNIYFNSYLTESFIKNQNLKMKGVY